MRDARDAHANVVINVIDDAEAFLTHHITHCVAYTLQNLATVTRPERKTRIHVCSVSLKAQKIIIIGIHLDVMEHAADVNFVEQRTPANTLGFLSDVINRREV